MKLKSIITVSGRISSGKSYTSRLIHSKFGFPIASFGSYLRFYCEQNGLPMDRKTLQDTGQALVNANSMQFLKDVLSHFIGSADIIILEGIRHKSILEEVSQLTGSRLSVFVEADLETRYKRYLDRNKESDMVKSFEQFEISDNHPVENEIDSLKPFCNIIVDSTGNREYSQELFAFISGHLKV